MNPLSLSVSPQRCVCRATSWSLSPTSPCAPSQRARPDSPVATRWRRGRRWCRSPGTRSFQEAPRTRSSLHTSRTDTQVGCSEGLTVERLFYRAVWTWGLWVASTVQDVSLSGFCLGIASLDIKSTLWPMKKRCSTTEKNDLTYIFFRKKHHLNIAYWRKN